MRAASDVELIRDELCAIDQESAKRVSEAQLPAALRKARRSDYQLQQRLDVMRRALTRIEQELGR